MQNVTLASEAPVRPILFSDFDINPKIVSILNRRGITTPTPIQEQAIPIGLSGKDIIGIAQTGTGKTLAFVLPIIHQLHRSGGRALILVPTRELALQVDETIRSIIGNLAPKLWSAVLIGGASMYLQRQKLAHKPAIIVATPGRLRDHLDQRNLNLSQVTIGVLDEADRMFDMGFAPEVKRILQLLPQKRQMMLFSATMPSQVAGLASSFLTDPTRIEVTPPGTSVEKIEQEVCFVKQDGKAEALQTILNEQEGLTLIFTRTKHGAAALLKRVKAMGHTAAEIHSNKSLGQRKQALEGFKSGKYRILVATDIAARGIDVDDVRLVVNYDLPDAAEDYVHRIGRTGRAGRDGKAISLAIQIESSEITRIERLTGVTMKTSEMSLPRIEIYTRGNQGRRGSGNSRGGNGGGGRRFSRGGGGRRNDRGGNGGGGGRRWR